MNFNRSGRGGGGGGGGKRFGGGGFGKRGGFNDRFGGGRPAMHKATCSECGSFCEVPFKPTADRPVYCNNCFKKGGSPNGPSGGHQEKKYGNRDFGGDRGFGGGRDKDYDDDNDDNFDGGSRDFGGDSRQMHEATCDDCGSTCEVPFKPNGKKPIFCNNCFKKGGNAGNKGPDQFKEQIEILNIKLDRILKILSSAPGQAVKQEAKQQAAPEKAVTKKSVLEKGISAEVMAEKSEPEKATSEKPVTKKAKAPKAKAKKESKKDVEKI